MVETFQTDVFCYFSDKTIKLGKEQEEGDILLFPCPLDSNMNKGYDCETTSTTYFNVESTERQLNHTSAFEEMNDSFRITISQDQVIPQQSERQACSNNFDSDPFFKFCIEYSGIANIPPEETFDLFLLNIPTVTTEYHATLSSQVVNDHQGLNTSNGIQDNNQTNHAPSYSANIISSDEISSIDTSLISNDTEWVEPLLNHQNKKIPCGYKGCKGVYGRYQERNRHHEAKHSKIKRYNCEHCKKKFSRAYILKNHQNVKNDQNLSGEFRKCKSQKYKR